ncbi:MAG: hypothetical protein QWI73_07255 [Alphaproteobacteria bacterium]|nr:hypothetical protein [Alphaproteobacteria bacterium]
MYNNIFFYNCINAIIKVDGDLISVEEEITAYISEKEEKHNWLMNWKKLKEYKDEIDVENLNITNVNKKSIKM